jgi:hypothetical protein
MKDRQEEFWERLMRRKPEDEESDGSVPSQR